MAPIRGGVHEVKARHYLNKHGIKQRIEGYVQRIVMDAPDDALMYLYKLVGQDVALRMGTVKQAESGDCIPEPDDINNEMDEPTVVTASVHGLLLVQKPDGEEVQVPFSRMAAAHHATPVLLEKWCRDLADALRLEVNPQFKAGKQAVAAVFHEMDADQDRYLDMKEIATFLQSKGVELTQEQLEEGFRAIDLNEDGRVSLEEFEHHMGIRELPVQVVQAVGADDEQLALEAEILAAEEEMHREAEELFDEIDADGSGDLSLQEIWADLDGRGANMPYESVKALFEELDTDGDGRISLAEFKEHMGLPMFPGMGLGGPSASQDMLHAEAEDTFAAIDTDMSGFIEFDELWADLELRGYDLTKEQVMEVFADLDVNRDGRVSLAEFKAHMGLPDDLIAEAEAIVEMHVQAEEVFDNIDTDMSGDLDMEELWAYLQQSGADITREAAEEKFRTLDVDKDDKVSLKEFKIYLDIPDPIDVPMAPEQGMTEDEAVEAIVEAEAMFDQINESGSGYLNFEEVFNDLLARGQDVDEALAREIFKDMDMNGDGRVSLVEFKTKLGVPITEEEQLDEVHEQAETQFDQMDKDGDGYLSFQELLEEMQKGQADVTEQFAKEVFDRMDQNSDGKVSLTEFKNEMGIPLQEHQILDQMHEDAENLFANIDKDKSGYLDIGEIEADLKSRGLEVTREVVEDIFKSLDINNDGKVSLSEFKASMGLAGYDVSVYEAEGDMKIVGEPAPAGGPPDAEGDAEGGAPPAAEEVAAQDGGEAPPAEGGAPPAEDAPAPEAAAAGGEGEAPPAEGEAPAATEGEGPPAEGGGAPPAAEGEAPAEGEGAVPDPQPVANE
mmetsp:Transcript_33938/g.83402  ORF Transcript_33938/g.83402 Transcript_33938/m.83402 type:complete len:840 (+) Transcript_33938:73-2592(+)